MYGPGAGSPDRVAGLIVGWAAAVRSGKPVDIMAMMPVEFRHRGEAIYQKEAVSKVLCETL
jgi:hypothetical protein